MRVWTIQPIEVYNILLKNKIYRADPKYVLDLFRDPYNWMIAQMESRIGRRPLKVKTPIWAWYRCNNHAARPNIKSWASWLTAGSEHVRLEIELDVPALLSDFENWHYVLNYWYLPSSNKDEKAYLKRRKAEGFNLFYRHLNKKDDSPLGHQEILNSWENIFNIGFGNGYTTDANAIQVTFWEIKLDQIKKVDKFYGKMID